MLPFCSIKAQDSIKVRQDSLAFELCQLYAIDQTIRNPDYIKVLGMERMVKVDSLNFEKFISFVRQNGFPNEKMVGSNNWERECVCALGFIYLVHNPKKVAVEYYDLFKAELDSGNLNPELLAYALDRYYVSYEGRSYFNTPYKAWTNANGVCIGDKVKSDSLRSSIRLKPLAEFEFIDCSTIDMSDKPNYRNPLILKSIPN